MYEGKIPVSLFTDFRISRISDRFGTKGFGAVVKLMLHLAAQPDYRVEMLSGIEDELAAFCGISHGLMSDIIAYGKKLGLFRSEEKGASFYLSCAIFENSTSKEVEKTDENGQPLLKVAQKPENESKTGQNLISKGCADSAAAAGKKEKKKQKKKEDNIYNNLLNKLPYDESKVVYLTEAEYKKLVERFGEAGARSWIEKLENYALVFPKKYAEYQSHYRVILTWARNDEERKKADEPVRKSGYGGIRRLDA